MAGFEVIVRPVVFPVIRPPLPRVLVPEDDPSQGIAVLGGAGMESITLSQSEQRSWSRTRLVERRRVYDLIRLYAIDAKGKINRDIYFDIEVVTKVEFLINGRVSWTEQYVNEAYGPDTVVLARDLTRTDG
jgi:hypothetical protein